MSELFEAVNGILEWSAPQEITTRFGPRILRKAKPTEEFWSLYRTRCGELKSLGISPSQYKGEWEVAWWQNIDAQTIQRRAELRAASEAGSADIAVPAPGGCVYMPFQKAGIAFANRVGNCLIADEMGLGKTIQAIGIINSDSNIHRVLIVAKAKLKLNWEHELRKWLVRPMSIGIVDPDCWPTTDIAIVNYDILHKFPKKLEFMWDLVVADEIQQCKNPKARRTKALFGYRPSRKEQEQGVLPSSGVVAKRKVAMTGTPIENRPIEIQPVLAWLQPQEKRWSKWTFAKRYCGMQFNGFGADYKGASNLDELRRILRESVMVRRRKADVLTELSSKTRVVIEIEPTGAMANAIRAEREFEETNSEAIEAAQAQLELAKASEDGEFKAAIEKLRTSMQVAFTEMAKMRHATALAKVDEAAEIIAEAIEEVGPKVIVFAHHHDVLEQLRDKLPGAMLVTGQTSAEDAQASVKRFQTDPEAGPFLGSIRATGEGITLTAANIVYFVEQDWVPGKMLQCEDRAHRIGQRDAVTAYYLVVKDSLDGKVMGTLIDKMKVIEQALDKGVDPISQEPVILPTGYKGGTKDQYKNEGAGITDAQVWAIHAALKTLAGVCNGARTFDGAGFSKIDVSIGHSLANSSRLSPAQAALGRRIVKKYVKQLGTELVERCG